MKSYQRWIWKLPEWPTLQFDAQRIQTRLAAARKSQGLLLGKAEMIGLEGLQPHIRDSLTQEALTTSSIEGEKLDPESVRSSVARRLGLDTTGAPQAEGKRNIEGLVDVLQDATLNTESALTLDRLCNWHGALFPTGFSGMQRIDVGALRAVPMEIVSGSIGHTKVHYAAPPAEGLADQVSAFLTWFNQTNPNTGPRPMDGLVRAAVSHLWFETLHPFDDGNGRIGRAILQLALGQDMGQPGRIVTLSRQIESCKDRYYSELERTQRSKSMDVTAWVEWMLEQFSLASEFASPGVIDDLIIYRTGENSYFLVINGACRDLDLDWMRSHLPSDGSVALKDQGNEYAAIALQGPDSEKVLSSLYPSCEIPKRNGISCLAPTQGGIPSFVARTGYTGEDGFELFVPVASGIALWESLLAAGVKPCGLGARDTLRLEMGYPLNGSDLSRDRTPLEAGLDKFSGINDPEKGDFSGRAALERQRAEGLPSRLTPLKLTVSGPPLRSHYPVLSEGVIIGETCSGALSPSLGKGIAMAYLSPSLNSPDTALEIEVRGRRYPATIITLPFYKKPAH